MSSFKHKVVPSYCPKQVPKLLVFDNLIDLVRNIKFSKTPVDTGRKLNVHKTFRRRPGRLLNVLCTFNLCPVSKGIRFHVKSRLKKIKQPLDKGCKLNVHKTLSLLQLTKIPIYTISQNRNTKKL